LKDVIITAYSSWNCPSLKLRRGLKGINLRKQRKTWWKSLNSEEDWKNDTEVAIQSSGGELKLRRGLKDPHSSCSTVPPHSLNSEEDWKTTFPVSTVGYSSLLKLRRGLKVFSNMILSLLFHSS